MNADQSSKVPLSSVSVLSFCCCMIKQLVNSLHFPKTIIHKTEHCRLRIKKCRVNAHTYGNGRVSIECAVKEECTRNKIKSKNVYEKNRKLCNFRTPCES